jgi:hypothetical protein
MRASVLAGVLAIVSLGFVGLASGATVVYDDFNDGSLNTSLWTTSGPVTEADGGLKVVYPGNATSTSMWSDGTRVNITIGALPDISAMYSVGWNAPGYLAFYNGTGTFSSGWRWGTCDGVTTTDNAVPGAVSAGDTISFQWGAGSASLYLNGNVIATESTVVPTGSMPVSFGSGHDAGWSPGSVYIDSVSTSIVPEPSSVALLLGASLLSLLAYAWRKHNK